MPIVPIDFRAAEAFAGISDVLLVRPPTLANAPCDIAPPSLPRNRRVRHVVFVSLQGVECSRFTPHFAIESLIREMGLGYAFCGAASLCKISARGTATKSATAMRSRFPQATRKTNWYPLCLVTHVRAVYWLCPQTPNTMPCETVYRAVCSAIRITDSSGIVPSSNNGQGMSRNVSAILSPLSGLARMTRRV